MAAAVVNLIYQAADDDDDEEENEEDDEEASEPDEHAEEESSQQPLLVPYQKNPNRRSTLFSLLICCLETHIRNRRYRDSPRVERRTTSLSLRHSAISSYSIITSIHLRSFRLL